MIWEQESEKQGEKGRSEDWIENVDFDRDSDKRHNGYLQECKEQMKAIWEKCQIVINRKNY